MKKQKVNIFPQESATRHNGKQHVKPLSPRQLKVRFDDSAQETALKERQKSQDHE